jgi:uncharacterized protein YndB with AHSA1/START domain
METVKDKVVVTVGAKIDSTREKVWNYFTDPKHITRWCFASVDWYAPEAENDLRLNGRFRTRMAARDGSSGFDFEGIYTNVVQHEKIEYSLGDDRKVSVRFYDDGGQTRVEETFDAEKENPVEMQRDGWQAILNNFKKYCESE